jgi:hypothetical protein
MKDKAIFITSIVLVVVGVFYLGYTGYRFFTRDTTNTSDNSQNEQVNDASALKLQGNSNKEVLSENQSIGTPADITITVQNTSGDKVSTNYEGRAYRVEELFTFPNLDSDLPVDSKPIGVELESEAEGNFAYNYAPEACGTYYMALGDNNYWTKGRGTVSYGYVVVPCDSNVAAVTDTTKTVDTTGKKSTLVVGSKTPPQTKGAVAGTATKVTKGGEQITELPKAGSSELLLSLGMLSILTAFGYRFKKINA